MIVTEKELMLEMSEGLQPQNFRIKATSKAFEILSAGLYSDRVRAIIRELSTNAADAHIAAGKANEPFEVHLPNSLEPFFFVKDNGTGLSHEQIMTLYTTYFDSDKTDSNDVTGCLGLGSKSPFSYTDQFSVESRWNGVKYSYTCHKDRMGLPAIVKMGETPTDECNGLEVRFPVKNVDFYEFCSKASDVLRWFSVRPVVSGARGFSFSSRTYMRQTPQYGLCKEKQNSSYVVMGNVAYPVSAHDLGLDYDSLLRKVLEWGCDIFVPIGTIDITANREKPSYDKNSVALMKATLDSAVADIQKEAENIIITAPTFWQARRSLHNAQHNILGKLRNNLSHTVWQGRPVTSVIDIEKISFPNGDKPTITYLRKKNKKFKKSYTTDIECDDTPIIVNDSGHGGYSRVIAYLDCKGESKAYLLSHVNKEVLDTGLEEVLIRASTLPKPERRNKTSIPRRAGVKAKLNEFVLTSSSAAVDHWAPAEVDLDDGGIYVVINYFKYKEVGGAEFVLPNELNKIIYILRELGYTDKIYGIRPADVKMLSRHDEWVSLDAFVEAVLEEHSDLTDIVNNAKIWYIVENSSRFTHFFDCEGLDNTTLFGRCIQQLKEYHAAAADKKAQAYARLASLYHHIDDGYGDGGGDGKAINALVRKVFETYPLFNHLNWYNADDKSFVNGVVDYVNSIDK